MASKKLIEVFDQSTVNLMGGWALLILSINDFNSFSPCSHQKNMSSMYLHHKYGLNSNFFIFSSSSFAIYKMLYGGANFLPITVSRLYSSVFFPNVNMLFFNTTSDKSIMVSVVTYFFLGFQVVFLMQENAPHAVCLDIILQHPWYIK